MPDLSVMQILCKVLDTSVNERITGTHLNEVDFKKKADQNLLSSLGQIKKIKREKNWIHFFGGAGTGLLLSALYSPDNIQRAVVILVGLAMVKIN